MTESIHRPRIAITLGDPRGIGPEVTRAALADAEVAAAAAWVLRRTLRGINHVRHVERRSRP